MHVYFSFNNQQINLQKKPYMDVMPWEGTPASDFLIPCLQI